MPAAAPKSKKAVKKPVQEPEPESEESEESEEEVPVSPIIYFLSLLHPGCNDTVAILACPGVGDIPEDQFV